MNKQDTQSCVANVRAYLQGIGSPISASQGYEVVARAIGLKNKHVLASATAPDVATPTQAAKPKTPEKPLVIFTMDQRPYTTLEMLALNWTFEVVIPMGLDCLGNIDSMNDTSSKTITGSESALEGMSYSVYSHFYDDDTVAIKVTGYISEPRDAFGSNEDDPAIADDETVAEWVDSHLLQDFNNAGEEQQAAWRLRYAQLHPGIGDDDSVAEWVGVHYRQNFSHSSEDQQAAWRLRYAEMHSGEEG
jgi:hypothetical protein